MDIFDGLSLWPWFLAAAHAFAAAIFFGPRLLRSPASASLNLVFFLWSLGGAAAIAALVGIIEKANAGLLAGRTTWDVAVTIAVLALFGALAGVIPMMGAISLPGSRPNRPDRR